MSLATGEAVVVLHGDIYDSAPMDWAGNPVEGEFIEPHSFREAIAPVKDAPRITFHLNSRGGDLYSGISIYNAIKQLPGHTTIIIDAVAASAASIIAMAGDEVLVHPSSTFMIHEGAIFLEDWCTPGDVAKIASEFESSTKAMLNIYQERTGRPLSEIEEWVRSETWFTGQEIVMAGFADRMVNADLSDIEGDLDKLSEDIHDVLANGETEEEAMGEEEVPEDPQAELDERKTEELEAAADVVEEITEAIEDIKEAEAQIQALSVSDIKARYPQIAAQLINEGAMTERKRLQEIDEISQNIDPKRVHQAKYGNPVQAKDLAFEALRNNSTPKSLLSAMMADAGATNVVRAGNTEAILDEEAEAVRKAARETRK